MGWIEELKTLDFAVFQWINGGVGRSVYGDAAGLFAAEYLIVIIALLSLLPFVRIRETQSGRAVLLHARRNWFFPSGKAREDETLNEAPGIPRSVQRLGGIVGLLMAVSMGYAVRWGFQQWLERMRPYVREGVADNLAHELTSPSFPSGHATVAFAIACFMLFTVPRLGGWLVVCAILVALGRVFIGVHYPADVAAGALLGLVSAVVARIFVTFIFQTYNSKFKSRMSKPQLKTQ